VSARAMRGTAMGMADSLEACGQVFLGLS